ncbi:YihY/virulence factor BrkB family protein [Leucobacter coleopterorum]|uniref:YihY/virulence factor BrkB family protein n=1 Tax=Leucobacter coleopterorum TaxID=2714933 RepID=A0ABX6JYU5_9MICO|nr:YhjD/YihY/BrkB family envelope integrity protein [Leucobacter coleopterorum]QIM19412.1 YihY/virulence factor BrkB family protein [Leucobacter coleopterorum]
MTTPRLSKRQSGEETGASRVSAAFTKGKGFWGRMQRTRPLRTFSHFTNVGGNVLTSGMSYQALFAVFAALWVGFGVLGIWLRDRTELLESIVMQINTFIPGLLAESNERGAVSLDVLLGARALDWTSIIAGVTLIWVALNWFTGTRRSIRIIFGLEVKQYRSALLLKLRDLMLAMGFFLAILVSAALTVLSSNFTESLFAWLGLDADSWFFGGLGTLVRYSAMYTFDVLVLIAMHRFLAEVQVPKWSLLRGCALGGVALLGLKILGTALLGGASSNPLLATFAVIIGLLLWFNFICRALLLTASWIAVGQNPEFGMPVEGASIIE